MGYRYFTEAQRSVADYIAGHYSQTRPHKQNGGVPPKKTEEHYWKSSKLAASFTGPLQYLFDSIAEVQGYATRWLWTFNNERPNMGLGGITPMQKLALAA
jgi:putative transposase